MSVSRTTSLSLAYAPDATRSFNASAMPGLEAAACLIFFTCGIGSIQTHQIGSFGLN